MSTSTIASAIAYELTRAGDFAAVVDAIVPNALQVRHAAREVPRSFLLLRDGQGTAHAVLTVPSRVYDQGQAMAFKLATTVAARASRLDAAPDLRAAHIARLRVDVADSHATLGQASPLGFPYAQAIAALVNSLQRNEWIGISLRETTASEQRWNRLWRSARGAQTNQTFAADTYTASVWAGSFDRHRAGELIEAVPPALAGFELRVRAEPVDGRAASGRGLAAAGVFGLAAAAQFALPLLTPEVAAVLPGVFGTPWWGGLVLGAAASVGIGIAAGRRGLRAVRQRLRTGLLPTPPRRLTAPRRPQKERTTTRRDPQTGQTVVQSRPATAGDYPLHPTAVILPAFAPVVVVAPHGSSAFAQQGTTERTAPTVLREPIGPLVGHDAEGPVFLSAADAWSGAFITGLAGSGKTKLMESFWAWQLAVTAGLLPAPAGLPGRVVPLAIDTKGDAAFADAASGWQDRFGVAGARFDVADAHQQDGIEFFPLPDAARSARAWAEDVVDTLRYVYGDDAVGPRSRRELTAVFQAAVLLAQRPGLFPEQSWHRPGRSPFVYANVLIGNSTDEDGARLADLVLSAAAAAAADDSDRDLSAAGAALAPIYGPGVTPAQRRSLFDAPRSKIEPLMALDQWWSRPQQRTWGALLQSGEPVVLNLGRAGAQDLSELARQAMGAIALHTMWKAIRASCVGWERLERRVAIYAPEVKYLAATGPEVVEWLRNDGRSYGVAPVFDTQFPEQLPDQLRKTMLGYGTVLAFRQGEESIIRQLLSLFQLSGGEWHPTDLSLLPVYTAAVRTTWRKEALPSFTVRIPDFDAMTLEEFLAAQSGAAAQAPSPSGAQPEPAAPPPGLRAAAAARDRAQARIDRARAAARDAHRDV